MATTASSEPATTLIERPAFHPRWAGVERRGTRRRRSPVASAPSRARSSGTAGGWPSGPATAPADGVTTARVRWR